MLAVCCEGVLVPCVGPTVCASPTGLGSTGAACNAGEAEIEDCGGRATNAGKAEIEDCGSRVSTCRKGGIEYCGGRTTARGKGRVEYRSGRATFNGGKGIADNRDNRLGGSRSWAMGGFIIGKPLVPLSEAPTKLVRSRLVLVR